MNRYRIIGLVLLAVTVLNTIVFFEEYKADAISSTTTILILVNYLVVAAWAIYYLFFKSRKHVEVTDKEVIVRKKSRILNTIDRDKIDRVVVGIKGIKIVMADGSESNFQFRDFTPGSANKLRSLRFV